MEREIQQQADAQTERQTEGTQTQGPDLDRGALSQMDASRFNGSTASQYLGGLEITNSGQAGAPGSGSADSCPAIPNTPEALGRQLNRTPTADLGRFGEQIRMRERENPGLTERTNEFMTRSRIGRHIGQEGDRTVVRPVMMNRRSGWGF